MLADIGRTPEVVPGHLDRQGDRHDHTATIDRRIRRHIADSTKPNKATNGTYGDPTATTKARMFDSGRARTTSVTTETTRAATASAVSCVRSRRPREGTSFL